MKKQEKNRHIPVLLPEILQSLEKIESGLEGALVVDATFGAGGYTRALLEAGAHVIALDRDPHAIAAGQAMVRQYGDRFQLVHARFSQLGEVVHDFVDAVVFDIGVSSMQIDEAERGFSFQKDGPLDMRMSSEGRSAADIVNHFEVSDLARLLRRFGEERHAHAIARMIVKKRMQKPFTTTLELAQAIEAMARYPRRAKDGKKPIHPATRVFQALRIFVNDELGELVAGLRAAEQRLKPGGRLAVVSFHSLEDRIVKQFFNHRCARPAPSRYLPASDQPEPSFSLLFKGAKMASEAEKDNNPRARSARLRVGIRSAAPALEISAPVHDFADEISFPERIDP